jgi:lysophospholipase L1-like esterase
MELVDAENPRLRYQVDFRVDSTEWRKVEVPWNDFMPFLPDGHAIDPAAGYRPSGLGWLNFGKSPWCFEFPAHSFTVEDLRLEPALALDTRNYTPDGEALARVRAKLAARRPLVVATMGDSLTSRYHWANRETCWVDLFAAQLRSHAHSEVAVINHAMGGHQLSHGLLHMGRWLARCENPDLVTVWFGGNDWADGMREERFKEMLRFAIDHIRRRTRGSADILLMTTVPALSWELGIAELGDAARAVAAEKNTGVCDTYAAFLRAGEDPAARKTLYAWDEVHLGEAGHRVAAEAAAAAILGDLPRS